ncbi:TetR family transcriptional regulator [Rhizobium sullae]|uniref:TetR family transcriptional regulator n=1 Tax=Rhizobium sullae TaxID=50338 RepID=A0A4R3QBL4_RHISU|nr:TetR family transcriptional regulator [Rhizobium sullae]
MLIPGVEADLAHGPGTSSERKQAAIVGASAEVFLGTGYAGASMDEIASRSGVSKQTVYKYFSSKEALFVAVMSQMMGEADTAVPIGLPNVEDRSQLEAYLLDYAVRQRSSRHATSANTTLSGPARVVERLVQYLLPALLQCRSRAPLGRQRMIEPRRQRPPSRIRRAWRAGRACGSSAPEPSDPRDTPPARSASRSLGSRSRYLSMNH